MSEELKPCPFCGWKKVTIAGKKVIREMQQLKHGTGGRTMRLIDADMC